MLEENFKRHPNLSAFILLWESINKLLIRVLRHNCNKSGEFCRLIWLYHKTNTLKFICLRLMRLKLGCSLKFYLSIPANRNRYKASYSADILLYFLQATLVKRKVQGIRNEVDAWREFQATPKFECVYFAIKLT